MPSQLTKVEFCRDSANTEQAQLALAAPKIRIVYEEKYYYLSIYSHFDDGSDSCICTGRAWGSKSGRDGDKAQALGLHTAYTANGTPYYTEAAMVIECKIMYAAPFDPQYFKSDAPKKMYANFPAGIHSMYIGEVVNAWKK